jgi:parallel beta-helix repeat protein
MRKIIFTVFVLGALLMGTGVATALPPGGTFVDDDGNIHEGYIEAIAEANISRGCNPPVNDRFCPDNAVTRGQMAAFLVRTLGLTSDGGRDWFDDDNGTTFESDINKLAASGITKGCNPPENSLFCPDRTVSRGAMAAFLARAFNLSGGGGDRFVDDNGSIFESDIEAIAAAGITVGCNPPMNTKFCPDDAVRRDVMATFLARASGLGPKVPPPRIDLTDIDVVVQPQDDLGQLVNQHSEGTVFLVHGEHRAEIYPKSNQAFIGGDGAVMNGEGWRQVAFGGSAANVTVSGFEVTNYNNPAQWGAIQGQGPGWVVEHNEVHHNAGVGIMAMYDSPVIRNNHIHHNNQLGFGATRTTNGLIEGNEVHHNNYNAQYEWGWEAGGSKFSHNNGLVVRNNYVHNNHGPGLWTDGSNINTLYEGNTVIDNFAAGIFHEISYDAIIRNNTVRGNGWGDPQWLWGGGITVSSSLNVEIYGNHVEGNFNGITAVQQNRGSGDFGDFKVQNIYVHDNLVVNSGGSGIATDTGDGSIWSSNNRFRGNDYVGGTQWHWNGHTHDWGSWQAAGQDQDGSYSP